MDDSEKIIAQCKEAIVTDKNNLEAYSNWREAIKNLQEPDQALEEYRNTVQKNLDTPDAYKECGNLLLSLEKFDKAIEEYQKALNKDDKYKKAYNNLGVALDYLERYEEAIEQYKKATEIDDKYKDAYYNWGNTLDRLERYEEAIEKYKKAIEIDRLDKDAYINWGCTLLNLERYEEAIEEFKMATDINEKSKEAYNNWGVALYYLERYEEAIEQYKKATEKDDKYKDAYNNWGEALNSLERYDEAIKNFDFVIKNINDENINDEKVDDEKVDALMGCAYALEKIKRYEDALNKYTKASECNKKHPYPIHCIAALKDKQGLYNVAYHKWYDACEMYEEKTKIKYLKNKSEYFFYYGSIYQYTTLKNLSKAEEIYNLGLAINPNNTQILINLISLTLEKSKDDCVISCEKNNEECNKTEGYYKAREYFNRAEKILNERIDKRKSVSTTYFNLGKLNMAMKKNKKAEEYFTNVLSKKDDKYIDCLIYLGSIYMQDENYEKAIQSFEEAIEIDPDNLDLRSNLAEAYLMKGQTEKAEREYRVILDITDYHMDSLIGIAQTYKTMGENAKERKDLANAEIFFKEAENYQNRIVKLMQVDNVTKASEILNENEKSDFYYSKGYNEVLLYETEKAKNCHQRLRDARTDFKKVKKSTLDFYKAQRAITKIDERLNSTLGIVNEWGAWVILISSLIVFILVQLNFFAAQPIFSFITFKTLEPEYYTLITFGCLLFMIAGLYLRQITKLKVGAFELEKSTIDQNPTSSLGVDKNSFNKAPRFHNHMLGKQGPDDK